LANVGAAVSGRSSGCKWSEEVAPRREHWDKRPGCAARGEKTYERLEANVEVRPSNLLRNLPTGWQELDKLKAAQRAD